VKRRQFLGFIGTAVLWSTAVQAQPKPNPMRRIGLIVPAAPDDAEYQIWVREFLQALAQLNWVSGRNIEVDTHWATADAAAIRRHAAELVRVAPDIIMAAGTSTVGPVLELTRTIPVVFPTAVDPVGAGFVSSLARPGGNATGFLLYEYSLGSKWLELLKQMAPDVTRVAVLRDPTTPSGSGQFGAIQVMAGPAGVEVLALNISEPAQIERDIGEFARVPNGGLILTGSGPSIRFHDLIIRLAVKHRIPAVYYERFYAAAGGLLSYGADRVDQYRRSAEYVDRILKGESPAELPVQAPTKYELVINLKTAKAIGLKVPDALLSSANEVIE
jgi:putative ABC transport system substrate-binding protein